MWPREVDAEIGVAGSQRNLSSSKEEMQMRGFQVVENHSLGLAQDDHKLSRIIKGGEPVQKTL